MRLSRNWLSEFVDIDATSKEYEDKMTMSGSKVEFTEEPGENIKNVVIGKVTELERHPDSDHLWVCKVDIGEERMLQIVTGAQNLKVGDIVPVAKHHSLLPGGVKITKGKLRGVESEGMLCSLSELGLDKHDFPNAVEDGIFVIDEPCSIGDDICPLIGADDRIVEFEITNNRPDCLSVIGLARETAATFDAPLKLHKPHVKGAGGDIREHLAVEIKEPELCPRYTCRMIKNIKIAPSPLWMRRRLRAMGVRPINNIVDITNYVMLEYGQPMHAFDYACLDGNKIVVRRAQDGEKMNTLDGTPRTLDSNMLVIADADRAVGVAGVMGGENSEITESTQYAVFESANFNGTSVRRTAMRLNMRTDASSKFEKGLDPENTLDAVERACELVEMLGAGEVIDGIIDVVAKEFVPTKLKLEADKINALLGTDISDDFMVKTLRKLGFAVEGDSVTVPSWRGDVEHYSDIAEEVARFYGYDNIGSTMFKSPINMGGFTPKQEAEREVSRLLRGMGYSEIITYSFIGPGAYDKIRIAADDPIRKGPVILNPLGEDTSVMRTVSLPSMLEILGRNKSYKNDNVRLFELARVYRDTGDELPDERIIITLGAYGDGDFFTMKGAVEALLAKMKVENVTFAAKTDASAYHPGRCAEIKAGDKAIGVMGQIHPKVAEAYGLSETYTAEIDFFDMLAHAASDRQYKPLPKYPAITRDIAVVCDNAVTIAELESCIKRAGGELLRDVKLFDIYTGSHIAEGKKSTAFSLTIRSDEQTLTDAEADAVVKDVLAALDKELGAVIR